MNRAPGLLITVILLTALQAGCSNDKPPTRPSGSGRTYRMGFSPIPPRPDVNLSLLTINLWSQHADAGLLISEPPWDSLLAGRPPDLLIRGNQLGYAKYIRARGLRVVVSIDPTNGLDRASESSMLVAAGRSLSEPAVQALYRDYVTAMDTIIHPDYLGIASETNLIRAVAPSTVYDAVVAAAAAAATSVAAVDSTANLYTTVQVETAWGRNGGPGGYVGIAQDRADFPFDRALGLSSYPYLGGFKDPDSIPLEYYSRLQSSTGGALPMIVIEGGWPSVSVGGVISSPAMQSRYIARHMRIQDEARTVGWFQITFTDLDVAAYGNPGFSVFAYNGLVYANRSPKPALATWDAIFARPRR
jgi:hypothetical protein